MHPSTPLQVKYASHILILIKQILYSINFNLNSLILQGAMFEIGVGTMVEIEN